MSDSREDSPIARLGQKTPTRPLDAPTVHAGGMVRRAGSYLHHHGGICIVFVLALVAMAPLFHPGYFWGAHDARHDVYFMFEYDKAVQEGNWFPSWGPDWAFGYGYPFWIIYAPLTVIAGEVLHHFGGFGWETCVKAVMALSIVISGLGMYGFVRSWLGHNAALVAAAAYIFFPYHLVDIYVRAALPESVAIALFPLVLWAFRAVVLRPRPVNIITAAVLYAVLMWTHNLSMLIFTPGLAVYICVLLLWERRSVPGGRRGSTHADGVSQPDAGTDARSPKALVEAVRAAWAPALAAALGLALSAGFWVPALLESRFVNQEQWFGQYYNPFQHFVYFHELFNPAWGYGISLPGPDNPAQGSLSYQLGAAPLLLAVIGLITARRLGRLRQRELWVWAIWGAVAIFLTLGVSAPAWHLPLIPLAQFPWRYLMLAAAPISVLAATLVAVPGERLQGPGTASWPTAILVALLLLGSYPYVQAQMREPTPAEGTVGYQGLMRFEGTSDEMTGVTVWVDPALRPHWSAMADVWISGKPLITRADYSRIPQDKTLAVNAEGVGTAQEEVYYYTDQSGQTITFNRFWYPGWKAYLLSGQHGQPTRELPVLRENGPLARTVVPLPGPGEGYILLRFEDSPLRAVAKGVTYATLAGMALAALGLGIRGLVLAR